MGQGQSGEPEGLTPLLKKRELKPGLSRAQTFAVQDSTWSARASIAYVIAIIYCLGSWLFVFGSIACYGNIDATEPLEKTWTGIPYFIGATLFGIGNYLLYFQLINKFVHHGGDDEPHEPVGKIRFIAWPEATYPHVALILLNVGAWCFEFLCITQFLGIEGSYLGVNLFDVLPGVTASVLFCAGCICEGEYNDWRACTKETFQNPAVWSSFLNALGCALFVVGYASNTNHMTWGERWGLDVQTVDNWLLATPWLVGSAAFLIASHIDLFMWKKKIYGLGFAKEITDSTEEVGVNVDMRHFIMIIIYTLLLCSACMDMGLRVYVEDTYGMLDWLNDIFTLMVYTIYLTLGCVMHRTPLVQPYSTIIWMMRFLAVYDVVRHVLRWQRAFDNHIWPMYAAVQ